VSNSSQSQSVPRDGGYCNDFKAGWGEDPYKSQSVPRDGGYCNARRNPRRSERRSVSIRPEGRGVLQQGLTIDHEIECDVSIRPEGRGVLQHFDMGEAPPGEKSQSVPRDGGYCNSTPRSVVAWLRVVSIRPEGRGILQRGVHRHHDQHGAVSIRPEGRGVLQRIVR